MGIADSPIVYEGMTTYTPAEALQRFTFRMEEETKRKYGRVYFNTPSGDGMRAGMPSEETSLWSGRWRPAAGYRIDLMSETENNDMVPSGRATSHSEETDTLLVRVRDDEKIMSIHSCTVNEALEQASALVYAAAESLDIPGVDALTLEAPPPNYSDATGTVSALFWIPKPKDMVMDQDWIRNNLFQHFLATSSACKSRYVRLIWFVVCSCADATEAVEA